MRQEFFKLLYEQMKLQKGIYLLVGDLGYGGADKIKEELSDQFINCGAAEQAMIGIACGLAMTGKVPFVYSITNFSLYRPFELIRNYMNFDQIPVKLIGSGRDKDYEADGISHQSEDAKKIIDTLPKIVQYWPNTTEEMEKNFLEMIDNDKPCFFSLER